jgi:hypothetical protein
MNLVTINIDGTNASSGSVGADLQALAVHPTGGTVFAGTAAGDVYTIVPGTPPEVPHAATLVGASGANAITGMDFDSSDVLFAVLDTNADGGGDTLATINTTSGAASVVGAFGADGFQAIAFHPDGTLYGTQVTGILFLDTFLYVIDPSDGSLTFDSVIEDFLGFPPDGGIAGLQFDCDETLYAGTAFDTFFSVGGNLGVVDEESVTPVYTLIGGPSVASFNGGVAALAFADACAPPPPPILEVEVDFEAGPDATPMRCNQLNRDLVTAVLSTAAPAFDATTIDADTVSFGRDELSPRAAEKHQNQGSSVRHEQDVNLDGLTDMVFHFRLGDTDFSCADIPGGASSALIPAILSGQAGGEEFEGSGEFEMRN